METYRIQSTTILSNDKECLWDYYKEKHDEHCPLSEHLVHTGRLWRDEDRRRQHKNIVLGASADSTDLEENYVYQICRRLRNLWIQKPFQFRGIYDMGCEISLLRFKSNLQLKNIRILMLEKKLRMRTWTMS